MKNKHSHLSIAALALVIAIASGCNKMADTTRAAESITRNVFTDTTSSWVDLFTYNPPVQESFAQTRYCYHMQSDIVCYDSEQPRLTSKLVGYQDGDKISWTQPGGGSLGVSGGEAIALRPALPPRPIHAPIVDGIIKHSNNAAAGVRAAANDTYQNVGNDIYTGPTGGVSTTSGQISVQNLPSGVQKR